ncbi:MAG: MiaB/RimO family radical SAM methylthiotransferase [Endomicrobiia bacterium]
MNRYFIRTFGCKTNQYESQLIKELLVRHGKKVVENYLDADIVVINSCAVTYAAERDVYKFIRRVYNESKNAKRIILSGCYAEYVCNHNLHSKFFERLSVDLPVDFLGNKNKYTFINPKICEVEQTITKFFGPQRAYVKIQDGCNNFCSYCIVPYLRNPLISRPEENILKEIEHLYKNGYTEIYLVGTNIAKYNFQGDFIDLSEKILKIFPKITLLFSSLNPSDLTEKFFDFLIRYKNRIFSHFHIALQSPVDEILEDMRRDYTYGEFLKVINRLKKVIPDVIISSDVIVGYPLETKEKFKIVFDRLKNLNLNWYHIFPYSPRYSTECYKKYGNFTWSDTKLRVRQLNLINQVAGGNYFKQLCKVI